MLLYKSHLSDVYVTCGEREKSLLREWSLKWRPTTAFPMPTFILFFIEKGSLHWSSSAKSTQEPLPEGKTLASKTLFSPSILCSVVKAIAFCLKLVPKSTARGTNPRPKKVRYKSFLSFLPAFNSRPCSFSLSVFVLSSLTSFLPYRRYFYIPKHKHQKISPFYFWELSLCIDLLPSPS